MWLASVQRKFQRTSLHDTARTEGSTPCKRRWLEFKAQSCSRWRIWNRHNVRYWWLNSSCSITSASWLRYSYNNLKSALLLIHCLSCFCWYLCKSAADTSTSESQPQIHSLFTISQRRVLHLPDMPWVRSVMGYNLTCDCTSCNNGIPAEPLQPKHPASRQVLDNRKRKSGRGNGHVQCQHHIGTTTISLRFWSMPSGFCYQGCVWVLCQVV